MTAAPTNRTLLHYLTALLGADDDGLLEIRARRRDGMSQTFYSRSRLGAAAAAITRLGRRTDVYVGCAPRRRRAGHRDAIDRVWVLWADCDTPAALKRLAAFTPAPAIVIRSGSASNAHAYWLLDRPVDADAAVTANRRLAHALGADSGAVTAATAILRPPGTRNHKHSPPRPVIAERLQLTRRTTIAQLTCKLTDPPAAAAAPATRLDRGSENDPLLAISPRVYVAALTGRTPGRDGKIACPLHPDDTPSLHAYSEPERGWWCFGCQRGGSVYDLGAAIWNLQPRGREFLQLRTRLHHALGVTESPR